MEQIILRAKIGQPVTKIVGRDVVIEKPLSAASLVERRIGANRRLKGKQPLQAATVERRIRAAVAEAKGKTKAEGAAHLKLVVDGLISHANKMGGAMEATHKQQIASVTRNIERAVEALGAVRADSAEKDAKIAELTKLVSGISR
jgi:predicted secreted Zn-dependent protease